MAQNAGFRDQGSGAGLTDAMATREAWSERAWATPATYASRFAVVNSVSVMPNVAVKDTADVHSEQASQGSPSPPEKPNAQ